MKGGVGMISAVDMRGGVGSKVYFPLFIYTQKITAYVGAIPLSSAYPPLYPECVTLLPQHGFWAPSSTVVNPYISVSKTFGHPPSPTQHSGPP